ncbi:hypothetical protein [Acidithiobacillus caldus]|uniref:Uncharacterized protein n=1 Tax=Acidithiobacillus caldus TaxID=33059 RepID=A0A1E7Z107_9PROT|nr:hypothetical protein [Acidithiobacillus caldus]OFC36614.1 hypothetical protein BAE27_05975 [Acidithiobacillus caldus]OFC38228.1 hypothetical protein BAE29_09230 [Acidithiobacillus caldus]OFC39314.1 hypothetical protein BAE28_03855 [Acidithiobacillus caldus]OFC62423.1 hypothetical protein BAE30_02045 [Acidithiobacillus caldus]
MNKGKVVNITLGQDTACYWTGNLVLAEAVIQDETKLEEQVTAWATRQLDNDSHVFDPEFDFSSPRIVCATIEGKTVLEDLRLGPRYHDAGLCLSSVFLPHLDPALRLQCFVAAVEELGHDRDQALRTLAELFELARADLDQPKEATHG